MDQSVVATVAEPQEQLSIEDYTAALALAASVKTYFADTPAFENEVDLATQYQIWNGDVHDGSGWQLQPLFENLEFNMDILFVLVDEMRYAIETTTNEIIEVREQSNG